MATKLNYDNAEGEKIMLFFENGTSVIGEMFDGGYFEKTPDGKYDYYVRHLPYEWSDPESVKRDKTMTVNFLGTLVTDKPLDFGDKDELVVEDWDYDCD